MYNINNIIKNDFIILIPTISGEIIHFIVLMVVITSAIGHQGEAGCKSVHV